jgi:hypothetical protein
VKFQVTEQGTAMTRRIFARPIGGFVFLTIFTIGLSLACSTEQPSAPDQVGQIERVAGTVVEARAGAIAASPIIKLTDRRTGKPIPDAVVEFQMSRVAGYYDNPITKTDAAGIASAGKWHVGTHAGGFQIDVVVGGLRTSMILTILADAPTHFGKPALTPVGATDEVIDGPLLTLYDRFENPTPGMRVDFKVVRGDGALESAGIVTDQWGLARAAKWRLGSKPGENAVVASADGVDPVWLSVVGVDAKSLSLLHLEGVRQTTNGFLFTPHQMGLGETTLRITGFDRCLCKIETGYYIVNVSYAGPWPTEPSRTAGSFELIPPLLIMPPIKGVGVTADGLELQVQRDDGDGMRWTETWIFR